MTETAIEWAPFRLADGVDEDALIKAADQIQTDFLSKQPGYVRRELIKDGKGEFVDVIWWTTLGDAERAMQLAATSPACAAYFSAMAGVEDAEAGVRHFQSVRSFQN